MFLSETKIGQVYSNPKKDRKVMYHDVSLF